MSSTNKLLALLFVFCSFFAGDTFIQDNVDATHGVIAACSGRSVSTKTPRAKEVAIGGIADTTNVSITLSNAETNVVALGMESASGGPGYTSWDAGNWTVRMNVVVGQSGVTLDEVYICRINSSGVNQATVGSQTGIAQALTSTGVYSYTISGASQTAASSDRFYIAWVFTNTAGGNKAWQVDFDQNIDTPLTGGGGPSIEVKPLTALGVG